MSETLGTAVASALRSEAQSFAAGDQVAPCAVLWPDPGRQWESVIPELQRKLPELFVLGAHSPAQRTGPALWLRCVEARVVEGAPAGATPILYLPGVARDTLRAAEDCPKELAPLVELQYRGVTWLHPNGKEWTPYAFLVSKHGGLGLDVAKDQATLDALAGALPSLVAASLVLPRARRLDSDFFNELVAPDATGLLLQWLNEPELFRQRSSEAEWNAFSQQCRTDFHLDPVKDGPLKAAQELARRGGRWSTAWQRFAKSPANHPGIVEWLRKAAPREASMFDTAEVWPAINENEEKQLLESLAALADRPQDEAIQKLAELEAIHGSRRAHPWQALGLSPLATALAPLSRLAQGCGTTPGAPTPESFADYFANEGWKVDAAALAALAASGTPEQQRAVHGAVRAVYLPWMEATARKLQQLILDSGATVAKRGQPIAAAPGRVVLFVDGLRMDVAQHLAESLTAAGLESTRDWEWSTIPSVTATAKPATSPIAGSLQGGEAGDEFAPRVGSSGQPLTHDRFQAALKASGWQCLGADKIGDPTGSAWTEGAELDKRGHDEGWKLARSIATEVRELVSRIDALLKAGWMEVIVVTDHGWLLLPGGLPKVELKSFLADHQWGRCAALKADAQASAPSFSWYWNPAVRIASPPGVGCYRAGVEYSHGGVSLQEMVTPVLRVRRARHASDLARLIETRWTGARCRIAVDGDCAGFRVDVRTRESDPSTSLLSDRQAREVPDASIVTVFLEDDADIGKPAVIVLIDPSGQVIDSRATTLGE